MANKKEKRRVEGNVEPQVGPQSVALGTRDIVYEMFFGGARGGGKSVFLLMDFLVDVPAYGREWHGVLFRRSYPRLDQLVQLSYEMFPMVDPDADFKVGDMTWHFSNGASLKFRHLDTDADAESYQGHSYAWLGFDELGEWPTSNAYNKLKATLRPSTLLKKKNVKEPKRRVRATGNPGGPGHAWIKEYFIDPAPEGNKLILDVDTNRNRMFIPSSVTDNKILLDRYPNYIDDIKAATQGDEQLFKAWLHGDWNVFFGRFFEQFDPKVHKVSPYEIIEGGMIPAHWRIEGSLDYGEAQPTSFGLWATSPAGVSYRIGEYYKSGLWVSEHAGRIMDMIVNNPYTGGRKPVRVWADSAIFHTRAAAGYGAANRMVADVFRETGLTVIPSNKDRMTGWRFMKNLLANNKLFYFPECDDFERQMLNAQYAGTEDRRKEDLDTLGEDHGLDETRYFCMGRARGVHLTKKENFVGTTFEKEMEYRNAAASGIPVQRGGLVIVDPYSAEMKAA